jgi:voltage-gated potassium channel
MSENTNNKVKDDKSPTTAVPAGRFGVFRFSMAQFLIALVLLFVGTPLVMYFPNGDLIEVVLITLVLLSGVLASGGRTRSLILAIVMVTPAAAGKWINHYRPDLYPAPIFQGAILVFFLFLVVYLLRFIFRAPFVNSEVLCAAISTYLLLGLAWAFAYLLVAEIVPDSFMLASGPAANRSMDAMTALYFSFVTLCTVGFGDVTPVSNVARILAILEAMTGAFYMAILIARLVSLYSSSSSSVYARNSTTYMDNPSGQPAENQYSKCD